MFFNGAWPTRLVKRMVGRFRAWGLFAMFSPKGRHPIKVCIFLYIRKDYKVTAPVFQWTTTTKGAAAPESCVFRDSAGTPRRHATRAAGRRMG